ncbi:ribonuclease HII [Maribacter sp. ACAM166]|nr:ribonuclease HII [Maribacter sp. ACAM166]TLP74408.1 ribonuclease HII [Maribacter sp. ACAM166]
MRHTLLSILILFLCITCTSKIKTENYILNLVPNNVALVFKINDFETLKDELSSNNIVEKLETFNPLAKIKSTIQPLNYLTDQKNGLLAFSATDSLNFDFTYITNDSLSFINWDNLSKKSIETLSYNSSNITKYQIEDLLFFSTYIENYSVVSSSQTLLKNLIDSNDQENINPSLHSFYSISNSEKILNIWLDIENGAFLLNQLFSKDQSISNFASWISLDLTLKDSEIVLNGVTKPNTKKHHFLNLFNGTNPIPNNTSSLLPSDITYYKSFGFNEFKIYSNNKTINNYKATTLDSLLNTVEEIGIAEIENEKILLLRTYGTATLLDYINEEKVATEEYNGNEIWELNSTSKIFKPIEPLIGESTFNYSSVIENTLVFSKTKSTLQLLLTKYKAGDTFNTSNLFRNAENKLTSSSSILTVSNLKGTTAILNESVSKTLSVTFEKSKLSDYVFGSQLIADDGFYHANFLIKKITQESESNTVSSAFEVQFNTDLAVLPQFVTNHNNRRKEIIVQDQENILYLISNSGKILWKKQLEGTIQGKVHQVDLFKNSKLQFAFTTNNEFLIVDRNGKEVKPFTKKFTGGNLNPLSVFDYEGKKNYRFLVTQNEKVFMFNSKGEIVKGFKYDTAEADILEAPQHFRIGKKDYLIFKLKNGQLKILNRVGNTRVTVKDKFSFSENEIKLYQNKFTFTSSEGLLFQIDAKGNITTSNLNMAKDHGMDATSRTLVIMNDNVLRIRDKKIQLELGVYSKPTIFYLNDKIYVSVTDIQNQKIYLFDSQAVSIPNFPVFGSSIIDMADMDNDHKAELVLKDQDNTLKVYKIN